MGFIENALKPILVDWVAQITQDLFTDLNSSLALVVNNVGQTPSEWNVSIFNTILSLAQTVMMPLAGLILTFVLGAEIVSMITSRNNMHDFDVGTLLQYIFKCFIAIIIVSNAWDICNAIFAIGKTLAQRAGIVIGAGWSGDNSLLSALQTEIEAMSIGQLLMFGIEMLVIRFSIQIMSIIISVILYGRMLEIYIHISVAPVPFATMLNREWGGIGTNYIKGIAALAFQGFFMIVCLGIYYALINSMLVGAVTSVAQAHSSMMTVLIFTALLCATLAKCGTISKSILNAH